MLIVVVAALLGIWRYRSFDYFKWVIILFVWMLGASLLFSGGGTLENSSGDGIITRQIRVATNDGPGTGIFAIGFIIAYWGGAIFFITRMVKVARAAHQGDSVGVASEQYTDETTRKAVETTLLLIATAGWIYVAFLRPLGLVGAGSSPPPPVVTRQETAPAAPAEMSVEQQLMGAAAEINADTPKQIDPTTTLVRASASGRMLTYHYRLSQKRVERTALRSFVLTHVIPKTCTGVTRPSMKVDGIKYIYSYEADGLSSPLKVTVDEATCARLET